MTASSKFASQVKLITALARRWGIHITLTDMLGYKNVYAKEANGLFTGGNHIVLDVNADYGLLTAAFTHEAYHYLEEKNKAAAEEMRKLVFDMLGEEGTKKARKEMRDRGYEEEYIDSEIVADSLFDALSEKGLMKKISSETRMTVSEMLAYLADSLEYMLNRLTGSESWRKQLRTQRLNYKVLSQMFERGMDGAENDAKRASLVEDIRGEKRPTVITKKNAERRYSYRVFLKDGTSYDIVFNPINRESKNNAVSRGDIILTTDEDIEKAIDDSLNNAHIQKNYIIGSIPESVKMKIISDVGVNIFKNGEYVFKISSDDIKHIKKHFAGSKDILKAIYRLYDVICNYDSIESIQYGGQTRLKFEKSYSDYDFLSIEVASKKTCSFDLVTFYSTKNNKKAAGKIQSPVTPKNVTHQGVSSATTNNVPQTVPKVKPSGENSSDTSDKNPTKRESKKKEAVSDEIEKKYLELAKHPEKNKARLREMVDEAAKRAGYGIRAYHGTGEAFTKFAKEKTGANYEGYLEYGAGFYFTPSKEEARKWAANGEKINGNNVMSVYLAAERMMNPDESISDDSAESILKKHGYFQNDIEFTLGRGYRFIEALIHFGYSNAEIQKQLKAMGYDGVDASYGKENKTGQYVIFDPEQVKSADLVTYDDNGEIIPLSRRFDSGKKDIRFSKKKQQAKIKNKASDDLSVAEQTIEKLSEINQLEPVATIKYRTRKGSASDQKRAVQDEYKKFGKFVDRRNFGQVYIGKNEIDEAYSYVKSDAEYTALFAVPYVIKRGILSYSKDEHKNRGYPTYTFSAKVNIGKQKAIISVVVKKTGIYRFKVVRILAPDGNKFIFENNKGSNSYNVTFPDISTDKSAHIAATSKKIIPHSEIKVKPSSENSSDTSDENPTKRESKKKEPAKSLKAEDVFGKDYGTEYAEAKAEIERLRRQVALAEEAVASFPVTKEDTKQDAENNAEQKDDPKKEAEKQLARLRRVLRAKEGIVRRTDKLRSIVAQMKIKNENPARYAGLFRQALFTVRKAGNFRPSPVNAEMRKTITEIEDAYEPTLDDLTTKRGLEGLKKNHRQIYDAFRDFIREKTYIRPFDTKTYTEAVNSVAKRYKVTDADVMWLAEELKNATEVYINKPSDIQPSYSELVKEFDTILSDITERAAKPADGNEWAQDVKGKTVKLTADEYAVNKAESVRHLSLALTSKKIP